MSQYKEVTDRLSDFRTDKRMLLLSGLAVPRWDNQRRGR
jgi:hypothetical protein